MYDDLFTKIFLQTHGLIFPVTSGSAEVCRGSQKARESGRRLPVLPRRLGGGAVILSQHPSDLLRRPGGGAVILSQHPSDLLRRLGEGEVILSQHPSDLSRKETRPARPWIRKRYKKLSRCTPTPTVERGEIWARLSVSSDPSRPGTSMGARQRRPRARRSFRTR